MSGKKEPVWFFCNLYKQNFYFFVNWARRDFVMEFIDEFGFEPEDLCVRTKGKCWDIPERGIVVFTRDDSSEAALVHELIHAVFFTFAPRGIQMMDSYAEVSAYYTGYLYNAAKGRLECSVASVDKPVSLR